MTIEEPRIARGFSLLLVWYVLLQAAFLVWAVTASGDDFRTHQQRLIERNRQLEMQDQLDLLQHRQHQARSRQWQQWRGQPIAPSQAWQFDRRNFQGLYTPYGQSERGTLFRDGQNR